MVLAVERLQSIAVCLIFNAGVHVPRAERGVAGDRYRDRAGHAEVPELVVRVHNVRTQDRPDVRARLVVVAQAHADLDRDRETRLRPGVPGRDAKLEIAARLAAAVRLSDARRGVEL